MELEGKTAIITGSTGRLGSYLAKALAAEGCNCICHYNRNKEKAEELVKQVEKMGGKAEGIQAELSRSEGISELFSRISESDTPQILINSAAVFSRERLEQICFEGFQKVLAVNLTAAVLVSRGFVKALNAKYEKTQDVIGKIINLSDVGGIRPWSEYVVYCSSKAGLNGATKAMAKELAPAICVNSIAIGLIDRFEEFDESQRKRQLSFIPAGRVGRPEEVTKAMIFLLKNDYITGQILNVDGGRCI